MKTELLFHYSKRSARPPSTNFLDQVAQSEFWCAPSALFQTSQSTCLASPFRC